MELILASNSPRRKELLSKLGLKFSVKASDYDEKANDNDPVVVTQELAFGKASSVYKNLVNKKDCIVLGADTLVYHDGKILGKPNNEKEAIETLKRLSGRTHSVITGFCLLGVNCKEIGSEISQVTFNNLDEKLILNYIDSGLYKGKAGSYGIQDNFSLVKEYDGSLNNIIGLPTERIFPLLKKYFDL